jgi:hypothetical protein
MKSMRVNLMVGQEWGDADRDRRRYQVAFIRPPGGNDQRPVKITGLFYWDGSVEVR